MRTESNTRKKARILERIFSMLGFFEYTYKQEIKYDCGLTKNLKTEFERY